MLALLGELEDHGGSIAFETPVERMSYAAPHWQVQFGGRDAGTVAFDAVVNSAGLGAQALARRIEAYPPDKVPPLILAKGNYFGFAGRPVFSRLIYPTPVDGGLGVHVPLDLAGRMRFGPDVEWIDHESYTVDPHRADAFYERIGAYWPRVPAGSLVPDYCGIRPKLSGPGQPQSDFIIAGEREHGLPRLVCLFGIESPGLTASLSLAEQVIDDLKA
jgi:L-2-hydroxyglutarate oxidase LhgO